MVLRSRHKCTNSFIQVASSVLYGLHKIAFFLLLCPLPGYDGSAEQAQVHKLLYTGCI